MNVNLLLVDCVFKLLRLKVIKNGGKRHIIKGHVIHAFNLV